MYILRSIILVALLFQSIFAIEKRVILEPDEAFKTSFTKSEETVNFKLDLGQDIYLYDDKLKFFITKPSKVEITKELNLPKPVPYEEWIVQFDNINVNIPISLLKSKVESNSYELEVQFQGCSKAGLCYAPMSEKFTLDLIGFGESSNNSSAQDIQKQTSSEIKEEPQVLNETDEIANILKDGSFFVILGFFFLAGLGLSLTPCIFPMIPILSSIIVKAGNQSEITPARGFFLSFVYVVSMSIAYTIAGVVAAIFGANIQVALQNPYVLTVFAGIFVALAFSMFGYYKLELPQSLQNKITRTTDGKQGISGIAIMGFLSALIVGPCVAAPLTGALVYIGQTGDAVLGGAALFVMSIGMGVPLLLIGLGAGKYMPKPGGWMDSVSKIFGIVMLAVAVWMLDRVLEPIYVMWLWALLFLATGIYLRIYKHILAQLITVVIFIYGASLMLGALSGATNPLEPYSKFTSAKGVAVEEGVKFKYVKNIKELDEAIKASSKPVMLDFYADWCVSCKELEGITFKDPAVIAKLNEFTLLKADVTKNTDEDKALQAKFGVVGPPALIFWDENNKEIKASQIVGYKNPKDFLEIVNKHF